MSQALRVGDVVKIERGTTYKSALIGQPGPILLGLGSIGRHGGFRADSLRTYGGDSPPRLLVRPGELYVSLKDVTQTADLLGAVARVPLDGPVGRLTQDTVRLDVRGAVSERYLYWMLRTPQYRDYCRSHATGTTTMGLSREDFFAFEFPEPSPRRCALVDLLDALDDKIAANERVVAALDSLAASSAEAAFTVAKVAVAQVASIIMGSSPPGSSYNERQIGTPFYQGVRDFGVRFPRRRVWTSQPVRLAVPGDTLLSVRAPVGRVNLASEDLCLGRGLAALRSRTRTPITLFHQLKSSRGVWEPYEAEGTVFGAISRAQLGSIALPEVDPLEAESLEKRLTTLEDCLAVTLSENRALAAARDALLPLLMSGRLRVKDAEKVVAEVV